ncbi:hypothetical protein ATL39_2965 [Sinobaca qinghaiensis]|uniref:Uncharacterized protein n=1 Tax=Sinobaca qinghaiensis TaxID=342944 RepID=A0A419UWN7_9BACL|nr:hypothetical protein ATL39_2965 [Sinobaca qinghaiensis]
MKSSVMSAERLTLIGMNRDDVQNLMKKFSDPVAMQYYASKKAAERISMTVEKTVQQC